MVHFYLTSLTIAIFLNTGFTVRSIPRNNLRREPFPPRRKNTFPPKVELTPVPSSLNSWERIFLNGPYEYITPSGDKRALYPSCSGGPTFSDIGNIVPTDTQFSFLFQPGDDHRKLMIFMEGGGACWNADTCILSPLMGLSIYTQEVNNDTIYDDGIFSDDERNPYKNYTKIVVPTCTGDVHWGSRDTEYVLNTMIGSITWMIHHRGSDNFLSVLHWLQNSGRDHGVNLTEVRDVSMIGESAGGYGTILAFPYVIELMPKAHWSLISDSAVGVINKAFYEIAIYNPVEPEAAVWGVKDFIPTWANITDSFLAEMYHEPENSIPNLYNKLSEYKPTSNLAMVTSDMDTVQIYFYMLMLNLEKNPPSYDVISKNWHNGLKNTTKLIGENVPNCRFHVQDGTYHTIVSTPEYYSTGSSGVPVNDWNFWMINWKNIQGDL